MDQQRHEVQHHQHESKDRQAGGGAGVQQRLRAPIADVRKAVATQPNVEITIIYSDMDAMIGGPADACRFPAQRHLRVARSITWWAWFPVFEAVPL